MFIYRKIRERFFGGIGNKILFKSIFIILCVIKFIRGVSRKFLLTMMDLIYHEEKKIHNFGPKFPWPKHITLTLKPLIFLLCPPAKRPSNLYPWTPKKHPKCQE